MSNKSFSLPQPCLLINIFLFLQKKDYDVALAGAFRRAKDKEMELQALRDEIEASMKLVSLKSHIFLIVLLSVLND